MRIQFQILLFLVCVNLACGIVLSLALPGSTFFSRAIMGGSVSDYEQRFNATDIAESWRATPFSGIPVVGDIFSGFYLFFSQIRFIIDGFPMLLEWIRDSYLSTSYATSAQATLARNAFTVIENVLRAIFAVMMAFFVVEFITGRRMPD